MIPVPVNLVVEDYLCEAVLRRILKDSRTDFAVGFCYSGGGYGNVKRRVRAFNNAAKGMPSVILVDLVVECPPAQITEWLPETIHPNLLFRIAVKEIESWLLADRVGLASFLGISRKLIPENVDEIDDPKNCLINLAKKSRKRELREAIVPRSNSTAKVGPDYNGQLSSFVVNVWNLEEAVKNSASLRRSVNAINKFQPTWEIL